MLPSNAQERKDTPVYSGFLKYFPDAIAEVARLSKAGNDQHNPGEELYWNRGKSGDELDALTRHLLDNTDDKQDVHESINHVRAVAWRAMAQLQKLCEIRDAYAGPEFCDGPEFEGYEQRAEDHASNRPGWSSDPRNENSDSQKSAEPNSETPRERYERIVRQAKEKAKQLVTMPADEVELYVDTLQYRVGAYINHSEVWEIMGSDGERAGFVPLEIAPTREDALRVWMQREIEDSMVMGDRT